ncbi:MAG: molybdenum cofactor biosynthesis protein MoaE [Parvularculaceae bacterium]|nr:molybdenum cofactor biosynthesis protein MoaE [Parvularculaceae bacterium]
MIELVERSIDPARLLTAFAERGAGAGAMVSFTGIVRGEGGTGVEALFLDHAPVLTAREIERAAAEARNRWRLVGSCIVHRVGRIAVGEAVVFAATAAAHRREAFEACDFLVDFLKTDAPFWKKEIRRSGEAWI